MDIEIDEIEQLGYAGSSSAKPTTGKPTIVPVDDAHPFDLDAYISGYSGTFLPKQQSQTDTISFLKDARPSTA